MEVCLSKAVVSESDSIQRKISLDPSAVNLKHFQTAWVLLEAVDMSAPRPLLRGMAGWDGDPVIRVGALVRWGVNWSML